MGELKRTDNKPMQYAVFILIGMAYFAAVNILQSVAISPVIDHYGLTEASQGAISAASNLGAVAALFSSLFLIGRVSKPKLHLVSLAAMALLTLPLGLAPSFVIVVGVYFLLGLSIGYVDTLASSLIADLFEGPRGANMMCALHTMFGLGAMLIPLGAGAAMRSGVTWNQTYLFLGVLGIAIVLLTLPVSLPRCRNTGEKSDAGKVSFGEALAFFAKNGRWLLLVTMAMFAFYNSTQVWLDRFLSTEMHSALGPIAVSLYWGGQCTCRLLLSFVQIPPMRYLRVAMPFTAVIQIIGILSGNPVVFVACAAVASFLSGSVIPMVLHVGCADATGNTLVVTTLVFIVNYIASMLVGPVMGWVQSVWSLKVGLMILAVCAALAAVCMYCYKPGQEKKA